MLIDRKQALKPFKKLRKEATAMNTRSPEAVHKFRTNLRRIEAGLDALGLDATRAGKRLLKHEKKLRKRAGKVRDRDVLIDLAHSLEDSNGKAGSALVKYLSADRRAQAAKLKRSLKKRENRFRKQLKRCASRIKKELDGRGQPQTREEALAASGGRVLELCSDLSRYPRLTRSNLHGFRLESKHLRNILKMDPKANARLLKSLTEVKDKAGEWHDWEELIALTRKDLKKKWRAPLLAQMSRIAERKFREATRSAHELRSRRLTTCRWNGRPVNFNAVKKPFLVKQTLAAA